MMASTRLDGQAGTRAKENRHMAQEFTRSIKRKVPIKTSVKGIPDSEWLIEIGSHGLKVRRTEPRPNPGAPLSYRLPWKLLLGVMLQLGQEERDK